MNGSASRADNDRGTDLTWTYRQGESDRQHRTYCGYVERVSGEYGFRLRSEIAVIISDLLKWASTHDDR